MTFTVYKVKKLQKCDRLISLPVKEVSQEYNEIKLTLSEPAPEGLMLVTLENVHPRLNGKHYVERQENNLIIKNHKVSNLYNKLIVLDFFLKCECFIKQLNGYNLNVECGSESRLCFTHEIIKDLSIYNIILNKKDPNQQNTLFTHSHNNTQQQYHQIESNVIPNLLLINFLYVKFNLAKHYQNNDTIETINFQYQYMPMNTGFHQNNLNSGYNTNMHMNDSHLQQFNTSTVKDRHMVISQPRTEEQSIFKNELKSYDNPWTSNNVPMPNQSDQWGMAQPSGHQQQQPRNQTWQSNSVHWNTTMDVLTVPENTTPIEIKDNTNQEFSNMQYQHNFRSIERDAIKHHQNILKENENTLIYSKPRYEIPDKTDKGKKVKFGWDEVIAPSSSPSSTSEEKINIKTETSNDTWMAVTNGFNSGASVLKDEEEGDYDENNWSNSDTYKNGISWLTTTKKDTSATNKNLVLKENLVVQKNEDSVLGENSEQRKKRESSFMGFGFGIKKAPGNNNMAQEVAMSVNTNKKLEDRQHQRNYVGASTEYRNMSRLNEEISNSQSYNDENQKQQSKN